MFRINHGYSLPKNDIRVCEDYHSLQESAFVVKPAITSHRSKHLLGAGFVAGVSRKNLSDAYQDIGAMESVREALIREAATVC
jgi:hypothetical protein